MFCHIFYKTRSIPIKFGTRFPDYICHNVMSKSKGRKVASFSISKIKVNNQHFMSFAFPALKFSQKTRIVSFTRQCRRIIQGRWKTFIIACSKYIQDNKYKNLSESTWFCRRCDKNLWCVFGFAVSIAVHLQNANVKFHKVVQRHYSGEMENV